MPSQLLTLRSTRDSTVERESKRRPVELQRTRAIDRDRLWIFTDGGAEGWHAAILVSLAAATAHAAAACRANTARNVGSELDGVILGLELAAAATTITIVSDFLWTGYYINGWRKISHPYLEQRVAVARELLEQKRFATPTFIHHGGHDGAATDFSRWNAAADELCKNRAEVDQRLDLGSYTPPSAAR